MLAASGLGCGSHQADPLLSHLKCGGVGPRKTHQSLKPPLNISWQKHPYNFKNQLSSSLFFTNLHDTGQGQKLHPSSEDGGNTVPPPPPPPWGCEELLRLGARDTGSACDPEEVPEPLWAILPHPTAPSGSF